MKINRTLRLQLLAQNWMFVLVFLVLVGLLGTLAAQYRWSWDLTQANRNILTPGSVNILRQMEGDVHITVFASDETPHAETFRKGMLDFVARYQREKSNIFVQFINPAEEPKLAQQAGVKVEGEAVIAYGSRSEHMVPPFVEQSMTNLLVRLSRTNALPVMALDGHGERLLQGTRNHDLGEFGKQLESKGFKFANPDLTIAQEVPANGAMLVIASPQVDVSQIEASKVQAYVASGGNVLWLLDDQQMHGLQGLADALGIKVSPGMVVDSAAEQYGADPKMAFDSDYGDHVITRDFRLRTVYPEAHEITAEGAQAQGWTVTTLIDVAPNGWLETDAIAEGAQNIKVRFDEGKDKPGPIKIGLALERKQGGKTQRVVVVGNANFLANTFLANGGNLDLGINIINWLTGDDRLISIQPMPLKDINVAMPATDEGRLVAGLVFRSFQYFIPLGLFIGGLFLWWRRRRA